MCIRDGARAERPAAGHVPPGAGPPLTVELRRAAVDERPQPASYTHLRAHEPVLELVFRLLLYKKKTKQQHTAAVLGAYTISPSGSRNNHNAH